LQKLGNRENPSPSSRRNAIVTGVELNELIGEEFEIQGVHFRRHGGMPALLLDGSSLAPGAFNFLKGRGGLRRDLSRRIAENDK